MNTKVTEIEEGACGAGGAVGGVENGQKWCLVSKWSPKDGDYSGVGGV